jgi:glutathione synthase/RimK-type ligase-like ATP-grasp enzyme
VGREPWLELTAERLSESREQIRVTPCLIQKLIIGDDVRIHVIDRACFAILIQSDAADYRYARGSVDFTPTDVPANIAKKCLRVTAALGLRFAGIDMKICETTGRWYCLEVNPMPGYSGYDLRMSGIISEALIEALESA